MRHLGACLIDCVDYSDFGFVAFEVDVIKDFDWLKEVASDKLVKENQGK